VRARFWWVIEWEGPETLLLRGSAPKSPQKLALKPANNFSAAESVTFVTFRIVTPFHLRRDEGQKGSGYYVNLLSGGIQYHKRGTKNSRLNRFPPGTWIFRRGTFSIPDLLRTAKKTLWTNSPVGAPLPRCNREEALSGHCPGLLRGSDSRNMRRGWPETR
jgi:hypothetical protein